MAFWAVEIKPNKPYCHRFDSTRGRLHLSQATLGLGTSANKCSLQCTLLGKSPVMLCSLFPDKFEFCSFNLEFDQGDDHVTFSVIGPRSIHIAGYYLPKSAPTCYDDDDDDDDSEPYGEDIRESDMSTDPGTDDDNYEVEFIDDSKLDASPAYSSPTKETVEISDDEKSLCMKGGRKRLKKKYQVIDSDGDEKNNEIMGGGRSIFSSDSEDADDVIADSEDADDVIGAKRKLPYFDEDESESDVEEQKKKKEKKDETLASHHNRGNEVGKAVEIVDKTKKKNKLESSDNRNVDEEVKEGDYTERKKKKKKKKNETETLTPSDNRNVDEEVKEEDGGDRKKKKKKKISSPNGK